MVTQDNALFEKFCAECRSRMQRLSDIFSSYQQDGNSSIYYDQIHQEFDSMSGASRAVNLQEFEQFNRKMASFARYLRQKQPEPATPEEQRLLQEAIVFGLYCGGMPHKCITTQPERIQSLLYSVTSLLDDWKSTYPY